LLESALITLEIRRLRGVLIEVFKILNGYEDTDRQFVFKLKEDSVTRYNFLIRCGNLYNWNSFMDIVMCNNNL